MIHLLSKYLITFKSTTAAFRANLFVTQTSDFRAIQSKTEIVAVPLALTNTCYGTGMEVTATESEIQKLYNALKKEKIDFKRFWHEKDDGSIIPINDSLEKGDFKIS